MRVKLTLEGAAVTSPPPSEVPNTGGSARSVAKPQYGGFTVAELKDILVLRGLSVSGSKAALITRLEADDAG